MPSDLHYRILQQSRNEDRNDGQRADVADKEPEDPEYLYVAADGFSVGELVVDIRLFQSPTYEQYGKKTSEGHEDV